MITVAFFLESLHLALFSQRLIPGFPEGDGGTVQASSQVRGVPQGEKKHRIAIVEKLLGTCWGRWGSLKLKLADWATRCLETWVLTTQLRYFALLMSCGMETVFSCLKTVLKKFSIMGERGNGRNVPGQEAGGAPGSGFLWIVKWLPLNLHNVTLNLKQGTFYIFPLIVLAPGRCLFTTGINTHSNQRKSEAQISNSCKSLVTDTGKHNSAPNFEITNMSISEHEGYRRALANRRAAKQ